MYNAVATLAILSLFVFVGHLLGTLQLWIFSTFSEQEIAYTIAPIGIVLAGLYGVARRYVVWNY